LIARLDFRNASDPLIPITHICVALIQGAQSSIWASARLLNQKFCPSPCPIAILGGVRQ
jgi:hypothetical protein